MCQFGHEPSGIVFIDALPETKTPVDSGRTVVTLGLKRTSGQSFVFSRTRGRHRRRFGGGSRMSSLRVNSGGRSCCHGRAGWTVQFKLRHLGLISANRTQTFRPVFSAKCERSALGIVGFDALGMGFLKCFDGFHRHRSHPFSRLMHYAGRVSATSISFTDRPQSFTSSGESSSAWHFRYDVKRGNR